MNLLGSRVWWCVAAVVLASSGCGGPPAETPPATEPQTAPAVVEQLPPIDMPDFPKNPQRGGELGKLTGDIINKYVGNPGTGTTTPGQAKAGLPSKLVGRWTGFLVPDFAAIEKLGVTIPDEQKAQARIPFDFVCSPEYKIRFGLGGVFLPYELQPGKDNIWSGQAGGDAAGVLDFQATEDSCRFTLREKKTGDVTIGGVKDITVIRGKDQALHFTIRRAGDAVEVEATSSVADLGQPLETLPFKIMGRLRNAD